MTTVSRERRAIWRLLKDSPSLRSAVEAWVADESAGVLKITSDDLRLYGEDAAADAVALVAGDDLARRVLEDDFFPHPPEHSTSTST